MKETKCTICGLIKVQLLKLEDGSKICSNCHNDMQNETYMDIARPEVKVWVGEVAKMGDKLYFNIPKEQKPFFRHKEKYSLVVRKLE